MDVIAVILAVLYVTLLVLLLLQTVMIVLTNDKTITLRNGILIILCLSCFLRSLFWIKISLVVNVPTTIMLILYFIPIWLNVFGISLLTVFYFETWLSAAKSTKPLKLMLKPLHICLTLNFIFLIFIISIVIVISQNSNYSNIITSVYEGYAAFLDIILALALCILGYNFYFSYAKKATKVLPRSLTTFYIINCLVTLTYFIRGIVSVVIAFQVPLPFNVSVNFSETHDPTTDSVLVFYLLLEWFPISCIVFLLWRRVYFKTTTSNESIEKLLLPSTSIDDEAQISINYNNNLNVMSDAEAVSLVYGNSSYISSYNIDGTDDDDATEYDSVIYPNDNNINNIIENSFTSIETSPTIKNVTTGGSRTSYVGRTPPPKHLTSAPKPAALDFFMNPGFFGSRSSPFAIANGNISRESSPSLSQISPVSNSSLSAYDSLLSKYNPPKLGNSIHSHLIVGQPLVNDRDTSKLFIAATRDSLSSNNDRELLDLSSSNT